jgi:serine/threonine protein phosphatase PrpC
VFANLKSFFSNKRRTGPKNKRSEIAASLAEERKTDAGFSSSKYNAASCTSIGKERAHNEDTLYTLNLMLASMESPISFGLYLIADGMGGHQSGEIASNLAALGVSQYLYSHILTPFMYENKNFTDSELIAIIKSSVAEAQKLIRQRVPGGGTTLTFVLILKDQCYSAHVGDTRLYLIDRSNKITLRTKDHTLVKRLVDLGEITVKEADTHLQRNVLYKALGQSEPFEPDVDQFMLDAGERILICSDGLWGVLSDEQMAEIIEKSADLDQAVCQLTEEANESGGPDNISVVMVEKLT